MKNTILKSLADKLPSSGELVLLQNKLDGLSDEAIGKLSASIPMLNLKSPGMGLFLGILFGGLGMDRFYKGDFGFGIMKLLLCIVYLAVAGEIDPTLYGLMTIIVLVWIVADLFLVFKGIKKDNLNKILTAI